MSPNQFGGILCEDDLSREPNKLDPSDFMEDRLRRLVRRALEDQKITMSRGAEILDLDMVVMKEIAAWWGHLMKTGVDEDEVEACAKTKHGRGHCS